MLAERVSPDGRYIAQIVQPSGGYCERYGRLLVYDLERATSDLISPQMRAPDLVPAISSITWTTDDRILAAVRGYTFGSCQEHDGLIRLAPPSTVYEFTPGRGGVSVWHRGANWVDQRNGMTLYGTCPRFSWYPDSSGPCAGYPLSVQTRAGTVTPGLGGDGTARLVPRLAPIPSAVVRLAAPDPTPRSVIRQQVSVPDLTSVYHYVKDQQNNLVSAQGALGYYRALGIPPTTISAQIVGAAAKADVWLDGEPLDVSCGQTLESFTRQVYLADGDHTVVVRSQAGSEVSVVAWHFQVRTTIVPDLAGVLSIEWAFLQGQMQKTIELELAGLLHISSDAVTGFADKLASVASVVAIPTPACS